MATTINGNHYYGGSVFFGGDLFIGNGTLSIGGTLTNGGDGYIGYGNPSNGVVNLTSASSLWKTEGQQLFVGYDGQGILNISGGGAVSVGAGTGTLTIGNTGVTGILNIGAALGNTALAAGTVDAANVVFGAETGTITFNHTNISYIFAAPISGAGTISHAAGVTHLTGDSSGFSGSVGVSGGSLFVDGLLGASSVSVSSGGALGGSSSVTGAVTIEDGASLLGEQGYTLSLGSLAMNDASRVELTLGAPDSIALFSVSGDFTMDGALYVTSTGAFDEGSYRLFDYGGTLIDSGLTIASLPAGFNPGDWSIVSGAGHVSLIIAEGLGRQYWDGVDESANSIIDGGAGTWNNEAANWTNLAGDINAPWADERAVFAGAAGGTVTIVGEQTVTGLIFDTTGYELIAGTGGSLALAAGGDAAITVNAHAASIMAPISGTPGLVKLGTGTLTLGGTNSYSGLSTVQVGTLALAGAGSIAASDGVDVKSGASFDISAITAAAATIGSISGEGTVAIGSKTLIADSAADSTFSGALTGTGSLEKQGSGTLGLTGSASNLTSVAVNAGRVALSGGNNIGNTTAVDISAGATLTVAAAETIGTLSGAAGSFITQTAGALTINAGAASTFAGAISGGGTLVKSGAGTLTLSGANTYAAGVATGTVSTTVADGSLIVDGGSIAHSTGNTIIGSTSGVTARLEILEGSVSDRAGLIGTVSGARGEATVGDGGSWANAQNLTVASAATSTGTLTVRDGGTVTSMNAAIGSSTGSIGEVTVTGADSSWTNEAVITIGGSGRGTLTIADGATVTSDSEDIRSYSVVVGNNSVINIGAASGQTATAAGFLDAPRIQLSSATSSLNFNHTSEDYTLSSDITVSTTGSINVRAGTTKLSGEVSGGNFFSSGPAINVYGGVLDLAGNNGSFLGTTYLYGGTLRIGSDTALGINFNDPTNLKIKAAATIEFGAGVAVTNNGMQLDADANVRVDSGIATIGGPITGSFGFAKLGSGTLILSSGSSNFSGGIDIAAGTLELQASGAAGQSDIAFSDSESSALRLGATFGNDLSNFGSDDLIDLQSLTFADGEISTSYASGTLTVTQDEATVTLSFADLGEGSSFRAVADSDGSTLLLLNARPDITGAAAGQTVDDDATLSPFAAIIVSDADVGDTLTATVTLDDAANGLLTNLGGGSYDVATGVYTVSGTAVAVQTALRGLVFNPADNRVVPGLTETTTFTLAVDDGVAITTNSTTTVVSSSVNDAPVGVADAITVAEGGVATSLAGGATSVLANDSDPDIGSQLTAELVTGPTNGTLMLNDDGTFSYTHDGSETTTDSFTYRSNDGTADSGVTTVSIAVTPVNDNPTDISLTLSSDAAAGVEEMSSNGFVIGTLDATDPESASGFTFELVASSNPADDNDNDAVEIVDGELRVRNTLLIDYEGDNTLNIFVQVTDEDGGTFVKELEIAVVDVEPEFVRGDAGNNSFVGGALADSFFGANGSDTIRGGGGNDTIYGGGDTMSDPGDVGDLLYGDGGDDYINGNGGNDEIYGGVGMDTLRGGQGSDTLYGEADADYIMGDRGADEVHGGLGNDTIHGGNSIVADLLDGADTLHGDAGNDFVSGNTGNDQLHGGTGNDTLRGGKDDDELWGDEDNDILTGDLGNDTLHGGLGNDTLYGGNFVVADGSDVFVFDTALGADNVDTIIDFVSSIDEIWLDDAIFTAIGAVGTLAAEAFHTGTEAATAAHRILYNAVTGDLFYDADGTDAGEAVRFAVLQNHAGLTHSDFEIVSDFAVV